jgi:hypothetical protein
MGVLYFGPFNPFHYSLLPLYLPSPIFQEPSIHILISSAFTDLVLWYYRCSVTLFSFPSFPEFHRIVSLLQTCSTSEFVYDHACFCAYVYLLDLSSMYERKTWSLCFWAWLTLLSMMSSSYIHLPSNHMSLLLMGNTPLCIYTTFSWSIHQL